MMSAIVYMISDFFFIAFASGEVQKWNSKLDDPEKTENKHKI